MKTFAENRPRLELLAAFVLLVHSLSLLLPLARTMTTMSLWRDEIDTIELFSGKGARTVLTDYRLPNNHLFFNLLNAFTPGRASLNPMRARVWSFAALGALLVLLPASFLKRGEPFLAALAFHLVAANRELVAVGLQARGYGLLAFFAGAASLLFLSLLERPEGRVLLRFALVAWLGTFTIPTFGLFAAPLFVILFTCRPSARVASTAVATGLLVAFSYAGVARELLYQARTYDFHVGRAFPSIATLFDLLRTFLFRPALFGVSFPDAAVFLALAGLLLLASFVPRDAPPMAQHARLLLLAVVLFFAICLKLGTPIARTVSFAVIPLGLAGLLLLEGFASRASGALRGAVAGGTVAFLLVHTPASRAEFRPIPIEDWEHVAGFVDRLFPRGFPVFVNRDAPYLASYWRDRHPIAPTLDAAEFAAGRLAAVDTNEHDYPELDPKPLASNAISVSFPQLAWGPQRVWFCPPADPCITEIRGGDGGDLGRDAIDRDPGTRWTVGRPQYVQDDPVTVRVSLKRGRPYRTLVLVGGGGHLPASFIARLETPTTAGMVVRPENVISRGDVMLLPLGGLPVESVTLTVFPGWSAKSFSIDEAWAVPEATSP